MSKLPHLDDDLRRKAAAVGAGLPVVAPPLLIKRLLEFRQRELALRSPVLRHGATRERAKAGKLEHPNREQSAAPTNRVPV